MPTERARNPTLLSVVGYIDSSIVVQYGSVYEGVDSFTTVNVLTYSSASTPINITKIQGLHNYSWIRRSSTLHK